MAISVRVEGLDRCIGILDMITTNVALAVQKEVNDGAKAVQVRERSLAPVKTGLLRKNIGTQKGKYGITKMVRAKAPHAPLQEFGTKRGVKALHFAERAKNELTPVIEAKIREAFRREVESP